MPDRSSRRRGSETRDALLRAATTLIERDGIGAVTTRQVALEAGVPLGTVHYWFADKADLLSEVVGALLRDVRAQIVDGEDGESLTERVTRIHGRLAGMPALRQLALFEVTTHAIRSDDIGDLARDQYASYTDAALESLAPWKATSEARLPGGIRALATLIVAVVDGLTLADLASPGGSDRVDALRLFSWLLERNGLSEPGRKD